VIVKWTDYTYLLTLTEPSATKENRKTLSLMQLLLAASHGNGNTVIGTDEIRLFKESKFLITYKSTDMTRLPIDVKCVNVNRSATCQLEEAFRVNIFCHILSLTPSVDITNGECLID